MLSSKKKKKLVLYIECYQISVFILVAHYQGSLVLVTRNNNNTNDYYYCICSAAQQFHLPDWLVCSTHNKSCMKKNSCVEYCLWKGRFTETVIIVYEAQGISVMIVGPFLSCSILYLLPSEWEDSEFMIVNAIPYPVKVVFFFCNLLLLVTENLLQSFLRRYNFY